MRWLYSGILALLFLVLLGIGYIHRARLFSHFDESYWKNRYEQSQWVLPMSTRTLGDDGLFLYEGVRLISGEDITRFNPEVPPLGKYAIGASVKIFGNGYWYAYGTGIACILAFFLLARLVIPATWLAAALTFVFTLDPLFLQQFSITMLDSLQLLFLLLTFACMLALLRRPTPQVSALLSAGMGCFAGLFSATKFPLLTPLIFLLGGYVLFRQKRKGPYMFLFFMSFLGAYLLPYLLYFLDGHSIMDWLRLQKSSIAFYTQSSLAPTIGSAFTSLLANQSQNLFSRTWESSGAWTPVWPLLVFLIVGTLRLRQSSMNFQAAILLGLFSILTLLLYSFIPFWHRYLLSVVPFLYLLTGILMANQKNAVIAAVLGACMLGNMVPSFRILFPSPTSVTQQFVYDWEHGFFADMYEHLSTDAKTVSRDAFDRLGKQTRLDAQIESATITVTDSANLAITYHTRHLGQLTHSVTLPIIQEDGQWRVAWTWDLFLPNFSEDTTVNTTVIPARRGAILSQGIPLAQDVPGVLVWITPKDVDTTHEPALLSLLARAFLQPVKEVRIHHRYVGNTLSDQPIPIGVLATSDSQTIAALRTFSGISFTPAFARWHNPTISVDLGQLKNTEYDECCSWLYSTTNYDGISGVEGRYNSTLKGQDGGTLVLQDSEGRTISTLISRDMRNGITVDLSP